MAPCARLRSLLASTRSGSTSSFVPRPVQVGQAPWGVLNEKLRGSSAGNDVPSYGQANCSEYRRSAREPARRGWLCVFLLIRRRCGRAVDRSCERGFDVLLDLDFLGIDVVLRDLLDVVFQDR